MASIYKEGSTGAGNISSLDLLDNIKRLVDLERDKSRLSGDEFLFFLKRWWCSYYKRPYKDPLLDSYTFEELYFEYCDVNYQNAKDAKETTSKTEIPQEEWDWAAEEEAKELAEKQVSKEIEEDKVAIGEGDTIEDEEPTLSDDEWAEKYSPVKVNPDADDASMGGDIIANFENFKDG